MNSGAISKVSSLVREIARIITGGNEDESY